MPNELSDLDLIMLELQNITRTFEMGGEVAGVFDISFVVEKSSVTVLAGPSGSGKTTILQVAGLLDEPEAGEVLLEGEKLTGLRETRRCNIRLHHMGFVFQNFNLVPVLNAMENVMLPLQFQGLSECVARQRACEVLSRVGLSDRLHHRPGQLSGGQQQRAAIARALAGRPKLILADEPTANLDHSHGGPLLDLMVELARENSTAFLVASHDPSIIQRADKVIRLADGRTVYH